MHQRFPTSSFNVCLRTAIYKAKINRVIHFALLHLHAKTLRKRHIIRSRTFLLFRRVFFIIESMMLSEISPDSRLIEAKVSKSAPRVSGIDRSRRTEVLKSTRNFLLRAMSFPARPRPRVLLVEWQ